MDCLFFVQRFSFNPFHACLLSLALAWSVPPLSAQAIPPDTQRISEPAVPDPWSNGWRVEPQYGRLSVTIPVGAMPGEISFPVSILLNGTSTTRQKRVITGYVGDGGESGNSRPTYGFSKMTYPMNCGVNLGSIEPTVSGTRYILEDGRVYYSSDFDRTTEKLLGYTNDLEKLITSYGFDSLPWTTTGMGGMGLRFSSGVSVSADGTIVRASSFRSFGSFYTPIIESTTPSMSDYYALLRSLGNDTNPHITSTEYCILMDKDRVRVFGVVSYKNPDRKINCHGSEQNSGGCETVPGDSGSVYLPLMIADRFRHYVTMRWSFSSSGDQFNRLHARKVDVRNQRGQGFTVRFCNMANAQDLSSNSESDQARIDFVGVSAPSVLVYGRKPVPYYQITLPEGADIPSTPKTVWFPGSVGYPTRITLGNPDSVPQPSWTNAIGSASVPPSTLENANGGKSRVWIVSYDSGISLVDPRGIKTELRKQNYVVPHYINWFEYDGLSSDLLPNSNEIFFDEISGVSRVTQRDTSGRSDSTHKVTWDRQRTGAGLLVNTRDVWNMEPGDSDRFSVYEYGDPDNPSSSRNNPTDLSAGFLNRWSLFSANGQEMSSIVRTSRTIKESSSYSKGAGLNRFLSLLSSSVHKRDKEVSIKNVYTPWDSTALQMRLSSTYILNGDWTKLQERETHFNNQWSMLETQQVSKATTTRFAYPSGLALAPSATTTHIWDGESRLQLLKSFRDAGTLKHGTSYAYDARGRVKTQGLYHVEEGTEMGSPNTVAIAYDDARTGLPTTWTTTYQEESGAKSLAKSQGDFDSGFRPGKSVDERGVATYTTYDLYGRPTRIEKDGEDPISISYPDEWTTITTQKDKQTIEKTDGFGRLIEKVAPNGVVTKPTYDLHNRVIAVTETTPDMKTRTSTTSYDLLDRPISETSFTGKRVDYAYSTDGYFNIVTKTTDPLGLRLVTITKTDPFGQVGSVTAPNGDVTSFTYDGMGNKLTTTIRPAAGGAEQVRSFIYDPLGRLISKKEPETGEQRFTSFNALNQAQILTELGINTALSPRIRSLQYDGLGRLRAQISGAAKETFLYQGAFLVQTARTQNGRTVTQTFAYREPGARLSHESTTTVVPGVQ